MKKILILLTLAIATIYAAATEGPRIEIRPVCCRYVGWKGIELSVPNVPYSAETNFTLQYKDSINSTNWTTVVSDPTYGPFVEDGTWLYYYWFATPTNNGVNQRFWRIVN